MRSNWTYSGAFLAILVLGISSPIGAEPIVGDPLPLYYDARTGNLTIDATNAFGGQFSGYSLELPFDGYRPPGAKEEILQSFHIENFTPFMDTFFKNATPKSMGESKLFEGVAPGPYSVGNVLPPGLTAEQIGVYLGTPGFESTAIGIWGGQHLHRLEPVFGASPFPALNDPSVGISTDVTWAAAAALQYDPGTGELLLDTSIDKGGTIFSYKIEFADQQFREEAFTPVTEGQALIISSSRVNEVGTAGIAPGQYSLGPVLAPWMTPDELSSAISSASFIGKPGHGVDSFNLETNGLPMALTVVPEPSSMAIVLIAFFGLLACRPRLVSACRTTPAGT